MKPSPVALAYVRFTSCSGCQLMLLDLEESLDQLAELVDIVRFDLICSAIDAAAPIDLVLVEGSISTTAELDQLLELRRRSRYLVAVGSCAETGGVNRLVKRDRQLAARSVYGAVDPCPGSFPPQPLQHFVHVDARIFGCPPERQDFVATLGAFLQGGWPGRQEMPVCMECRSAELRCLLLEDRRLCLGPVTRAGCSARCPAIGVGCEGCRGLVAEANRDELTRLFLELGLPERELQRRMTRFSGEVHD